MSNRIVVAYSIPNRLVAELNTYAARSRMARSRMVALAITEYLDRHGKYEDQPSAPVADESQNP